MLLVKTDDDGAAGCIWAMKLIHHDASLFWSCIDSALKKTLVCPRSWERARCMRPSPKVSGLPQQLSWLHRSGKPFCKGKKKSCHAGHRGNNFSSWKELHISADGYPPLFWKIIWLGHKHVNTFLHGEETWCTSLRMSSSSLCWVQAICYLHGIFQVWQAGSGLNGDLQNKVVCLLLPCCGHEDTEEDFANVEFWLKTRMQNLVICGFCQVLGVGLSSASRNWTDFFAQEGLLSKFTHAIDIMTAAKSY